MKGSLKLGQVAGIGVFVHWTFFLLLGWIIYVRVAAGENPAMVVRGVAFILALFGCIVLHEFGHALTAKRFHVRTRDITLLPIGGVARLERIPHDPTQELLIAVAGPAVNVVIAAIMCVVIVATGAATSMTSVGLSSGNFLVQLMWVNLGLVLFNMIPAFPMDGGRVLRALLARRLNFGQATRVAATVGQVIAVLFAIAGFFYSPMLLLIALFVYVGAQSEVRVAQLGEVLRGVLVRDAMLAHFHTVGVDDTVSSVIDKMTRDRQQDFPVIDEDDRLQGMLFRADVVRAVNAGGSTGKVAQIMQRDCTAAADDEMLELALQPMISGQCSAIPVLRDGRLVGLMTSGNVGQWLNNRSANDLNHQQLREPSPRQNGPTREHASAGRPQ